MIYHLPLVMLNSFQHLTKKETLKQVQGDTFTLFGGLK